MSARRSVEQMLEDLVSIGAASPLGVERVIGHVGAPLTLTRVSPHLWRTATSPFYAAALERAPECSTTEDVIALVGA